jgi:hypothetical protein
VSGIRADICSQNIGDQPGGEDVFLSQIGVNALRRRRQLDNPTGNAIISQSGSQQLSEFANQAPLRGYIPRLERHRRDYFTSLEPGQ